MGTVEFFYISLCLFVLAFLIAWFWLRSLDPGFVEVYQEPYKIKKVKMASTWMETADPIPDTNPENDYVLF